MDKKPEIKHIEPRDITNELKEAYLDYAVSVIVSRALPDVRDGLKPAHRRVLFTMHELGLTHSGKTVKSARIVGDTLGRYHPHGDIALYETMVRMAQDFSLRYPLVIGQGNFGSIDGDPPAHMRYSEAKLSSAGEELLADIEKDTVDFVPNYDATRNEPRVLPSRIPNILVNGTIGIAVGMATNIPTHNLTEVSDAILMLLDNPEYSTKDLMKVFFGPDFPSGGMIFNFNEVIKAYEEGKGAILVRGKVEFEESKNEKDKALVISEIPWGVNKSDLVKEIAAKVESKVIEGIKDIRDESNKEGIRVVMEVKSGFNEHTILQRLFKYTALERNFYLNFLALDQGIQPKVFNLKTAILAWIEHRKNVIYRRTAFDLKRLEERLHLLEGFRRALEHLDAIIALIRKSKDKADAKAKLIAQYKFTDIQAEAILEMPLRSLTNLEREKIEQEYEEKTKLAKELRLILKEPKRIVEIIQKETKEVKEKYKSDRKTRIEKGKIEEVSDSELIHPEDVLVIIDKNSYIKRLPLTSVRSQKKGAQGISFSQEEELSNIIFANTRDAMLFITQTGKLFSVPVYEIPAVQRKALGKPIKAFLGLTGDDVLASIIPQQKDSKFLLLATKKGIAKKLNLADVKIIRKTGINIMRLDQDDVLVYAAPLKGGEEILLANKNGVGIRFSESDIRPSSKVAGGIKGMRTKDDISACTIIPKGTKEIVFLSALGLAKKTPLEMFRKQKRGGAGIKVFKINEKSGALNAAIAVDEAKDTLIATKLGKILRTDFSQIKERGRVSQGIRLIKLQEGDEVLRVIVL